MKKRDILKIIATITMTIDHIAYTFFPAEIWLRAIGRMAFPIFAYQTAESYFYTSSRKKFKERLFLFGLISQLPFSLLFDSLKLNVIFSLLFMILMFDLYEIIEKYVESKQLTIFMQICFVLCIFINIPHEIPIDWGYYVFLFGTWFYWYHKGFVNKLILTSLFTGTVGIMVYIAYKFKWIYIPMFFSLALILFAKDIKIKDFEFKLPKWFGYIYYPLHITVIYLISLIIK